MNAIVCNTLSGAVTEYSNWDFHSITATAAGSATGLFEYGGEKDLDEVIVSSVRMPPTLRSSTLKKHLSMAYLSMKGKGTAVFTVFGEKGNWDYPFPLRSSGQTRAQPGKGIRENYLGFGVSNPCGQHFTLDRVEVALHESKTRRV